MTAGVPTTDLIAGFEQARQRFNAAAPDPAHRTDAFHAVFETVAWVGSIRDRLRNEGRTRPAEIDGVYFVRNLVIHAGADALERAIEGLGYGMGTYGAGPYGGGTIDRGWRWKPRAELPPHLSLAGLKEYDNQLVGRDPLDTFASISFFLAALAP